MGIIQILLSAEGGESGSRLAPECMNVSSCSVSPAGVMALLVNMSLLLLLACCSHQLVLSSCQRSHGRRGTRAQNKDKPSPGSSAHARPKGRLVAKDESECTWSVRGKDLLTLRVTCQKGLSGFRCEYSARPSLCPWFSTKAELYWKQVARALKKRQSVCGGSDVPIKAGLCRRAAREAHFRLTKTSPPQPQPRAAESCLDANRRRAEENCSSSWSSLCLFFFTMVQDYDC